MIFYGDFHHGAEVRIVLAAYAYVAGIDAVFGQGTGAFRIFNEQNVAVVVKVSDDGNVDALLVELVDDAGNGGCGFVVIDGDADQFASSAGQGGYLADRRRHIGGVGVGHGLHHDRGIAADAHTGDRGGDSFSALNISHSELLV